MNDHEAYQKAKTYFMGLYRSHLENVRLWRNENRKHAMWSLGLAADCREKLVNGARIRGPRI